MKGGTDISSSAEADDWRPQGLVPTTPETDQQLAKAAWQVQGMIEVLINALHKAGRPVGKWGSAGLSDAEQALSSATWLAWKAMQSAGAWLYYGDGFSFDRDAFIAAANVLRGGTSYESPGHWHDIAVGSVQSMFMVVPRPAPEYAAEAITSSLSSVFGPAFARLDQSAVAQLYTNTWLEVDVAAERHPPRAAFDANFYRVHEVKDKATIRLTVDLVWMAYQLAKAEGRVGDRAWFSFPMPGRATPRSAAGPDPTKRQLHKAFLDHRRQKLKAAAQRTQKAKARM